MSRVSEQKGFSLVELLVVIAIMGFIIVFASNQFVELVRLRKKTVTQIQTRSEAYLINSYLTSRIRQVGGGIIRPHMGLWLEDGQANCPARGVFPDCNGSDRLTVIELLGDPALADCSIVGASGSTLTINNMQTQCCTNPAPGKHVMLVENGEYRQMFISSVSSGGACTATVNENGQGHDPSRITQNFDQWNGATMTFVKVTTYYLNPTTNELHKFEDRDNDGAIDVGEDELLVNQVADLQFTYGFDGSNDGVVLNQNNNADEWQYNAPGVETLGVGGLAGAGSTDLRMLGIAVISGSPVTGASTSARVYNGPTRAVYNTVYSISQSRLYLRSAMAFNN